VKRLLPNIPTLLFAVVGMFNSGRHALEYLLMREFVLANIYIGTCFLTIATIAGIWAWWKIGQVEAAEARLTRRPPDHVG
jgi:hypothetical protein